jgi:hypothetical protein
VTGCCKAVWRPTGLCCVLLPAPLSLSTWCRAPSHLAHCFMYVCVCLPSLPLTRWLSYQVSPRASIFRRDSGQVDGMESFKDLMR